MGHLYELDEADRAKVEAAYAAAEEAGAAVVEAQVAKTALAEELETARSAVRKLAPPWDKARAKVADVERQYGVGFYGGEPMVELDDDGAPYMIESSDVIVDASGEEVPVMVEVPVFDDDGLPVLVGPIEGRH